MHIQDQNMIKDEVQSTRFKNGLIIIDESWGLLSASHHSLEEARNFLRHGLKAAKNKPICIVTAIPSDYAKGESK